MPKIRLAVCRRTVIPAISYLTRSLKSTLVSSRKVCKKYILVLGDRSINRPKPWFFVIITTWLRVFLRIGIAKMSSVVSSFVRPLGSQEGSQAAGRPRCGRMSWPLLLRIKPPLVFIAATIFTLSRLNRGWTACVPAIGIRSALRWEIWNNIHHAPRLFYSRFTRRGSLRRGHETMFTRWKLTFISCKSPSSAS